MFAKGVILFYLSEDPISYTTLHCSTTVKTLLTLNVASFLLALSHWGETADNVLWSENRNGLGISSLLIKARYKFQGDVYVKKKVCSDRGSLQPTSP